MSEYIDRQAEESDNSDDSDEASYEPKAKKAKSRSKKRIASDDDDEDEEDDEVEIRKEMKGFVVEENSDDEGEEEGDNDDNDDKDDEPEELDEEDLELINANLDLEPKQKGGRVYIEDEEAEPVDDRERIAGNLFDDGEVQDVEPGPARSRVVQRDDDDRSSESDQSEDNFIVGDDDEAPVRAPRGRRRVDIPDHAIDEARDVFGVEDFNFDEFYDEDAEMGDEDEEYPEEGEEGEEGRPKRLRRRDKQTTLLDQIEPSELERGFLGEADKRIQLEDRPERFQMRRVPVTEADDYELNLESDWVYQNAFHTLPISMQEDIENQASTKPPVETKAKIREALKFMRNQLFEVPFIAFYRKEYVEPELGINDLWKIYQWDEKWCLLQQRMQRLSDLMKRMQAFQCSRVSTDPDQPMPDDMRVISNEEIAAVMTVRSVEELTDVLSQFHLHYGGELPKMAQWEKTKAAEEAADDAAIGDGGGFKQASRNDAYQLCSQAGLGALAAKFGLTPSQFAENLAENYSRHEVEQYPVDPQQTAQDYICRAFDSVEGVLEGVKYMVAKQLSREPMVRRVVREMYRTRAVVCVRPTKKGRAEIDENHPIYTKKYIKNKPVKDLEKDEYLRLVQAQSNGLITMTLGPDSEGDEHRQTLVDDIVARQLYYRDEYSGPVQLWNKLREEALVMCLQKFLYPMLEKELSQKLLQEARDFVIRVCYPVMCLQKFLYPMLEKELSQKLLQEARDFVIRECCLRLYGYLKIGPYEVDAADEDLDYHGSDGVRVMAIAYPVERDQASFCAIIDGEGAVIDHMRLVHLTKRKNARQNNEAKLKEQDMEELKRFVLRRKPHVIAVSGENLDALFIKSDVEAALQELIDAGDLRQRVSVEIVDNELAKVYMNSKRAQIDFVDYPLLLRQAISLARRLQDPLPEFCQMCTADDEILCLSYHSLQDQVMKEELLLALTLEFINRVNEVGVDINRCLEQVQTLPMLQFVCGLGPRKATQLVKVLKQNDNLLESRTKLVTLCRMGPKVFMNCAGFIKIDTARVAEKTDSYVEVLDGSRVHPETYEWARKMAVDALEIDDSADPTSALEEILDAPERLKDLDLDAFAEELQRQGFGNKSITLYDIRAELNHRYKDLRSSYKTPNREDIFNMLTKETPQTFNVGKLVMGRVMHVVHRKPRKDDQQQQNPVRDNKTGLWACPWCHRSDFAELSEVWTHLDNQVCPGQAVGIKVRLENGITGFIPNRYISDRPDSFVNPSERVQINQPIYCRVLKVDTDRFQAELSCRSSDLADRESQFRPPKDRYYDFNNEDVDQREDEASKASKTTKTSYVKRVIAHPSFHNITYKDAERMLQSVDQGEAIIRPSSKGADHLTVTWKVAEGIYQHIDVREEGKEKPFSLGKSLIIGEEEFEDLDEIIARHIQPMAAHARDVMSYKYYLDSEEARSKEFIVNHLTEEKKRAPARIPYTLVPCIELPGKFMLSYLPRLKVRHEFLTVTPDGFRFRQQLFPSLTHLFKWFKEHYRDPVPGTSSASVRQTPMDLQSNYGGNFDTMSRTSRTSRPSAWDQQPVGFIPPFNMPAPAAPFIAQADDWSSAGDAPSTSHRQKAGAAWAEEARNWAGRPGNRRDQEFSRPRGRF
uniref:Suppressor of Ty 6 homolog n=1 Tax=Plectus sambesii TaxID=2011161 RepID=A0A914VLR4_9BILA